MSRLTAVPDPDPAEDAFRAALLLRDKWLKAHRTGTVTQPTRDEPYFGAYVGRKQVAMAYVGGGLAELMENVQAAEAAGRCPLHPPGAS